MPIDGFTLGLTAHTLDHLLSGGRVDKVTQPEPDELVMSIRCPGENYTLLLSANAGAARVQTTKIKRANPLEPSGFCMLLRKRIAGSRIRFIRQYKGDRIIDIGFDATDELGDKCDLTITCECMGRHSNLIFYDGDSRILECARHVTADVSSVRQVLPGLFYERPPMQDKLEREGLSPDRLLERLSGCSGLLRKAVASRVMGISEQTAEEIAFIAAGDSDALCEDTDLSAACVKICAFLTDAPDHVAPVVYYDESGMPVDLSAFPYATRVHLQSRAFDSLGDAMDAYFSTRDDLTRIQQKSTNIRHVLKRNIERCEKKLAIRLQTLKDSERMEDYRIMGELLTASIGQIPKGANHIVLQNWYDENCSDIDIPLDESMSPARNAQRYFKLYQKMRNASRLAGEQAEESRAELEYLEGQLENLDKCTEESDLQEIRAELERLDYVHVSHNRRQSKALPESKPMRFTSSEGFTILVGKNNVQNERLTFSAELNEMWLHAKDMPGSHVIIKGEAPGEQTLMDAAMLAAYYSKGQSSSNVPVDMTLRRYVKKPSGAKPGFVTFSHQKTVYVTPSEEYTRKLTGSK